MAHWRDDPIAAAGVALALVLIELNFPEGTILKGDVVCLPSGVRFRIVPLRMRPNK